MIAVNILFVLFIVFCVKKLRKAKAGLKNLVILVGVWIVANAILIGQQTWDEVKWIEVQNEFCISSTKPK